MLLFYICLRELAFFREKHNMDFDIAQFIKQKEGRQL